MVQVGDSVSVTFNYGWDVGISNSSSQAVVADALGQNGLILTQYDNSQVGFTGGPASLTVRLQANAYADKQDVANAVASILESQLGLSVSSPAAVALLQGPQSQPLTIDAGPGSYTATLSPRSPRTTRKPTPPLLNIGVVGEVTIPIPRDEQDADFSNGGSATPLIALAAAVLFFFIRRGR